MVNKTLLDSGLTVISEYRPQFPSFALSYSVRNGSRNETLGNNGIHHFIEHMLFKGSKRYDLKKIADISDRLGGSLNAFTSKEITHYYLKAINGKLPNSFDLLTDMVMESEFPLEEFNREKNVILQEIKESEDDPETFLFESFYSRVFKDSGLGFPIAGSETGVASFNRDGVYDYYKSIYTPQNMLLSAVGKVEHEALVELAQKTFSSHPGNKPMEFMVDKPRFHGQTFVKRNKSLKQLYVVIGFKGMATASPLRFLYLIMNDILGAGMSSRLFQEVRENRGLAYTVNSFSDAYLETGLQMIYAIIEPGQLSEYLPAVQEEILKLKNKGITEEELARAKDHIKSSIILSLESNVSKMRFNVNQEIFLKRELETSEIIKNIDNASVEDINKLFRDFLDMDESAMMLYGDIPGKKSAQLKFGQY